MSYINLVTKQYPVSEQDIRNSLPNTSFATPFNPDGYAYVFPSPQPTYNSLTQVVQETTPVLTVKGTYEQQWEVINLPTDVAAANKNRQKLAELATLADDYKATTTNLQLTWLTAMVNDGTSEVGKKAIVMSNIAAAKSKYTSDVAAIISKYA